LAQKVENTSVRPSVLHTNPISCAQRRVLPTHPLVKLRLMRGPTINMKPIEPEGLRILGDPRTRDRNRAQVGICTFMCVFAHSRPDAH